MSETATTVCGASLVLFCVLLLAIVWAMFRQGLVPGRPVDFIIRMMDSHEAKLGTQLDELMALKARVRDCEDRLDALECREDPS